MSKFASFLAGMGSGYIKAKDKEYERERQAKDDAWREEQQGWQRADRAEKDALRTSMKDAFADRSTIEGTAVTGTTGTNLYKDPAQAQAAADEARIEADMRGELPSAVATMKATGITGNMSRGHQITTEPVDLTSLNSRDAKMARGVNALMAAGDPEKAISMENTVMQNQAARLGLDVAQLKFIDETTRRQMSNALASGATWHEGAAKFVTQSQYPTIKDVKGESVVSPDGKTVTLFAVMPDGTRKAAGTYPADETGSIKFMEQFGSLPIETRIGLMQGRATAAKDQANRDRDFALRESELKGNQEYRNQQLALARNQDARQDQTHRIAMEEGKLPAAVKIGAASLNEQIKSVSSALNKAMAEGQFDPNNPGTAQLLKQQADLGIQYNKLIQPYMPNKSVGSGLPDASVFDAQKPATGKTQQAAEKTPNQRPDVAAKAPQMATMAQAVDPLSGLGRQQIREKKAELEAERQRWVGNPAAARRLSEIDTLLSRINSGAY